MRPAWLVVVSAMVLGAGCDDGIVIEVRTDPDAPASEVELFLGIEECGECPGISPDPSRSILPGRVFFRDDSNASEARAYVAKVRDGVATFHIKGSEVSSRLTTVAALGLGMQPSAALLPELDLDGETQHFIVQLRPATGKLPAPVPPDGDYVETWTEPAALGFTCLGFERWSGGEFGGRAFIVPRNDPDCDGFIDGGDCSTFANNGTQEPAPEELSCTTLQISPFREICRLGGPTCKDGPSPAIDPCGASSYCVSDQVCASACAEASTPSQLRTCLAQSADPAFTSTRLQCTLPVSKAADFTHYELCPGAESFTFDVSQVLQQRCADDDTTMLQFPRAGTPLGFAADVKLGSTNQSSGEMYELAVKLRHEDACSYRMSIAGAIASFEPRRMFTRLALGAPGTAPQYMLLPLILVPTTCDQVASCHFEGDLNDSVYSCGR